MKYTSTLRILPDVIARTPRHLGINIEVQDNAETTNLWDWVADSGITVAREFHPEQNFRKQPVTEDAWGDIRTPADFAAFRQRVVADPAHGGILWENCKFAEEIAWMGVPDAFIGKVTALGIQPLFSLGYATGMYPHPLVKDLRFTGIPDDALIDWGAAASAYDYYFAVIYHYATQFGGRYFTMINEPENRWDWFHLPPELAQGQDRWLRFFWNEGEDAELGRLYAEVLGTQYAVLARIARMALEDVRGLLGDAPHARELFLSGPTTVLWEKLWDKAAPYLDACDYHHYHPDPETFRMTFPVVAHKAKLAGKRTAITEFNRYSGGIPLERILFSLDNSLDTAKLLMTVLQLSRPEDPVCEMTTLYLLHFPSTHRNYKHLLYGDMNVVDWTGSDTPLQKRGEEWYPSFEEMQVRFATPAYHMFRMLTRCAGAGTPRAVLRAGLSNPTSSGPEDLYDKLRYLAVEKDEELIITLLNEDDRPARNMVIDLAYLPAPYVRAVVRETSKHKADQVVAELPVAEGQLTLDVAAKSLTQLILSRDPLHNLTALRLEEATTTPGSVQGLELYQTTRLRAIATVDGEERDLTTHNILWTSAAPGIIRLDQGGLVQRLRHSPHPVALQARTLSGLTAEVVVPGDE